MARRPFGGQDDPSLGSEVKLDIDGGRWWAHVIPSAAARSAYAGTSGPPDLPKGPHMLMEGEAGIGTLITHPLNTNARSYGFLQPKYASLRTIIFEGFNIDAPRTAEELRGITEGLPTACVQDPQFGMGLIYAIRHIIETIEEAGVTTLIVSDELDDEAAAVDGAVYRMPSAMLSQARRAVNSIHHRALDIADDEKRVRLNNQLLSVIDPAIYPLRTPKYRKGAIVQRLGAKPSVGDAITKADADAVMHMAHTSVRKVVEHRPKELLKFKNEIELVTLETLIEKFEGLLNKNAKEPAWQTFLVDNPFILHLAFGYPIVFFHDQVSVGGATFHGTGGKIADIAVKAASSGNIALIEIKKPDTSLVDAKEYRGRLHAASRELAGAVGQVLDQRYQLGSQFPQLKLNSRDYTVENYAVQCLVIAGRMPTDPDQQKSFELFRNSMKSVLIVTYDEMLAKLRALLEFLRESAETPVLADESVDDEAAEEDPVAASDDDEEDLEA